MLKIFLIIVPYTPCLGPLFEPLQLTVRYWQLIRLVPFDHCYGSGRACRGAEAAPYAVSHNRMVIDYYSVNLAAVLAGSTGGAVVRIDNSNII